jgi:tetratricopeptide (TPR) repeat protein
LTETELVDPEKAAQLRTQAIAYAQAQKLPEAAEALVQAIRHDPSVGQAYKFLSIIWTELGENDKALEAMTSHSKLVPQDFQGHVNRGALNIKMGHYEAAIADYEKAVAAAPGNPKPLIWLANAYDGAGKLESALEVYDRAVLLSPDDVEIYIERGVTLRGQRYFDRALRDFDHALSLDRENSRALSLKRSTFTAKYSLNEDLSPTAKQAFALVDQSEDAFTSGSYDRAGELCSEAVGLAPENAMIWYRQGWLRFRFEDYAGALSDYSRAIELEPQFVQAYLDKGATLTRLGRLEEAATNFKHITELDDRLPYGFYNLGTSLRALHREAEAIQYLTKAIELDNTDADFFLERGWCNEATGTLTEALADFTHAVQLAQGSAVPYLNRGNILYDLGRYETARRDYSRAASLDPESALAFVNLAAAYEKLDQQDDVFEAVLKAVSLDPNSGLAHIKLANQYLRRKNLDLAESHFAIGKTLGHAEGQPGLEAVERARRAQA